VAAQVTEQIWTGRPQGSRLFRLTPYYGAKMLTFKAGSSKVNGSAFA
jgi:hypothetical protein